MNNIEVFPSAGWMLATKDKMNNDSHYAQVARKWEGDLRLVLEPDNSLHDTLWLYWDFWHGKCLEAIIEDPTSGKTPSFILNAPYGNFVKVLSGQVGPMQAMMGRMLGVKGSFTYFMRNVPTILDFVRCCQEVTKSWV